MSLSVVKFRLREEMRPFDDILHFTTESYDSMDSLLLQVNLILVQKYMEISWGMEAYKNYNEPHISRK